MAGKDGKKRGRAKENDNNTSAVSTTRNYKRRSTDSNVAYQEYCELPFTLSSILVDEFEYITRNNGIHSMRSLHVLPCPVTVKQVLEHYQKKRSNSSGRGGGGGSNNNNNNNNNDVDDEKLKQEQIKRFCDSLALLFDDALPVCLLYREERPQYESLQNDENLRLKRPCEIYGSTFLLRLLRRLPTLLCTESKKEMDEVGPLFADLVVLLQKNRQACFKDSYRKPNKNEFLSWEKENFDAADDGGERQINE
jgi:hypothetical protein